MDKGDWFAIAYSYMGQKEIPGVQYNPLIVRMWQKIQAPFRDDETPWCAAFVGACLEDAGIKSTRSPAALSYAEWGRACAPRVGAVAYMPRHDFKGRLVGGHVAFVAGKRSDGALMLLGGNQGDAVSVKPFQLSRITGYRWPNEVPIPLAVDLPQFTGDEQFSRNEA